MAVGSLREIRSQLINRADLQGLAFCSALAEATDGWLRDQVADLDAPDRGVALIAVGGYGRGELAPFSDLDLVLLHEPRKDVNAFGEALWYRIWDEGIHLDNSIRTPKEVRQLAGQDLRVALGLLDGRLVWGDAKLAEETIEKVRELWQTELGASFVPELRQQMADRHQSAGDLAYLLEPDLKEAHGGLRDVNVLAACGQFSDVLADYVDLGSLAEATELLTRVRVELHRGTGREQDRLLLQEQDAVAERLAFPDADELMRAVSAAGRRIARTCDQAWRRSPAWAGSTRRRFGRRRQVDEQGASDEATPLEPGIALQRGEVTLELNANLAGDPSLAFRLAAVAAERDLPIALSATYRLADQLAPPPSPWPDDLREAMVRLLGAGRAAIDPIEALDERDLVARLIPEWSRVRYHHQRNAYHRYTSDRHLLEAVAIAAEEDRGVGRRDLLLVGTLLHDIGKGTDRDHTELGVEVVADLGPRMGFPSRDVEVLRRLVEHHLLLADTATRRDLDDPGTIELVGRAVGDHETLELLAALTTADSKATGSSAWGTWKAGLVEELVRRTAAWLDGNVALMEAAWMTDELRELLGSSRERGAAVVRAVDDELAVAAPDAPGLLAAITGVLATEGYDVRSANTYADGGTAVDLFSIASRPTREPSAEELAALVDQAVAGQLDLAGRLAQRRASYASRRPRSAVPPTTKVTHLPDASSRSAVIEVRAPDRLGLLHELSAVFNAQALDVRAARVATVGDLAFDVFYLQTPSGDAVTDPALLHALVAELEAVVAQDQAAS